MDFALLLILIFSAEQHAEASSLSGRQQIAEGREAADLVFVRHSKAFKPPGVPRRGPVVTVAHMAASQC